jgi:ribosome-binding protein aMBF1 (putative translation factor)
MITGCNDDDSERLSNIEDEPVCFYCLEEIKDEIVFTRVIGRTVTVCKDCYEFQTSNK